MRAPRRNSRSLKRNQNAYQPAHTSATNDGIIPYYYIGYVTLSPVSAVKDSRLTRPKQQGSPLRTDYNKLATLIERKVAIFDAPTPKKLLVGTVELSLEDLPGDGNEGRGGREERVIRYWLTLMSGLGTAYKAEKEAGMSSPPDIALRASIACETQNLVLKSME
ncbi:hypothetical protein HAX54_044451, partial [Datura stramonium]|nr:hypothetical protein [Datura stramonium]